MEPHGLALVRNAFAAALGCRLMADASDELGVSIRGGGFLGNSLDAVGTPRGPDSEVETLEEAGLSTQAEVCDASTVLLLGSILVAVASDCRVIVIRLKASKAVPLLNK